VNEPARASAPVAALPSAAIPSTTDDLTESADEHPSSGGIRWPIVAGVGVLVVAGVVAGVLIARPADLNLPPAERTTRLPLQVSIPTF
jgi:hypothetical protein